MTRRILAIVDDLFFQSKIRATAEAVAVEIAFPRTKEAALQKVRESKPDLVLVDLHNQKLDPVELASELKKDGTSRDVPLLGFFSHVQTDLQQNALAAGFDQVIPRSVFSRDLADILKGSDLK
jgi:CheY-like chemotaxis protein